MKLPGLSRHFLAALAISALLLIEALWLHGLRSLENRLSDALLQQHALQSPGLAAFVDPADWRRLSPNNLTPWVTLSFKLDLALAGLRPAVFYLHQLVSAGRVAAVGPVGDVMARLDLRPAHDVIVRHAARCRAAAWRTASVAS